LPPFDPIHWGSVLDLFISTEFPMSRQDSRHLSGISI